jgi:hypothetical protein
LLPGLPAEWAQKTSPVSLSKLGEVVSGHDHGYVIRAAAIQGEVDELSAGLIRVAVLLQS